MHGLPEVRTVTLPRRVSVGMAVYNGERFLEAAVESILSQTYADLELIISDNASTDGTARICESFAARDSRVRYVRQPTNIGALWNFHYVLEHAEGDLFMWAAHDDLREPDCIECLVVALERNPNAVLASCAFDNLDFGGKAKVRRGRDWQLVFFGSKPQQFARFIQLDEVESQKANHIYGLIRRSALREAFAAVAGIDAYSGNDNCMLLELLGRGDFEMVPDVLFHYRVSPPTPRRRESELATKQPLLNYVWQRSVGRAPGHGGNVVSYLRRTNEYCKGMRMVVRNQVGFSWADRLYLQMLIGLRQIAHPIRAILMSARHEL